MDNSPDLQYQPELKSYSFKNSSKKRAIIQFLAFFGTILVTAVLFLVFLTILGYFNVISNPLKQIPSSFTNSSSVAPQPSINNVNGIDYYTIVGTLSGFDMYQIQVTYYGETKSYQWVSGSKYYFGKENKYYPGLLANLETKENIGKKLKLIYYKDSNSNLAIDSITLDE